MIYRGFGLAFLHVLCRALNGGAGRELCKGMLLAGTWGWQLKPCHRAMGACYLLSPELMTLSTHLGERRGV